MERLDKILANTGRWSRKEVRELVRAGRVSVDGVVARTPEEKHDPGAWFQVDGQTISGERLVYLMLHKPAGLVSATEDPREPTVLSLLPQHLQRVGLFPAGRLDKDTEGLLLLTNDGPLAHRLLSPKRHVDKLYYVQVEGRLDEGDAAAFQQGVTLEDGLVCLPAGLEILEDGEAGLVTLREGKYHQEAAEHGTADAGPGSGARSVAAFERGRAEGVGGLSPAAEWPDGMAGRRFRQFPQKTFKKILKREKRIGIILSVRQEERAFVKCSQPMTRLRAARGGGSEI